MLRCPRAYMMMLWNQHCGEQHLHRYLAEFDYRYSSRKITDAERAEVALKGIAGKRLTYRPTNQTQNA